MAKGNSANPKGLMPDSQNKGFKGLYLVQFNVIGRWLNPAKLAPLKSGAVVCNLGLVQFILRLITGATRYYRFEATEAGRYCVTLLRQTV